MRKTKVTLTQIIKSAIDEQMAQKHITVYRNYFNIGDQDVPLCEVCGSHNGTEIRHIHSRRHVSFKHNDKTYSTNDIKNLIGLCRKCHILAHSNEHSKEFLMFAHKQKMAGLPFQHRTR